MKPGAGASTQCDDFEVAQAACTYVARVLGQLQHECSFIGKEWIARKVVPKLQWGELESHCIKPELSQEAWEHSYIAHPTRCQRTTRQHTQLSRTEWTCQRTLRAGA